MKYQMILKLSRLCLAAGVLLSASLTMAHGGQAGGGGGVIQCVQANYQPLFVAVTKVINGKFKIIGYKQTKPASVLKNHRRYELLDLWEAESGWSAGPFNHHRLTIPFDNITPPAAQIGLAVAKLERNATNLPPQFVTRMLQVLPSIENTVPIPKGSYVVPPRDTKVYNWPDGCELKGLGYYIDDLDGHGGQLDYDSTIFAEIPFVDQAAFFMHESIYKVFRQYYNETNSWHTRRLVGLLFSTQETFTWNEVMNGYPSTQSNN